MKQFSLPRKYTVTTQILVSVVLIILAAILAFTPILSIDLTDNKVAKEIETLVEDLNEQVGANDVKLEFPDKIGVSMPKLISSVNVFSKVIGVISDTAEKASSGTDASELDKAEAELKKILNSKEGQETVIMAMGLIMGAIDTDGIGEDETATVKDSTIGLVVNSILSFGILFYLLGFVVIWPIILIIMAIVTLIKALKALKDGDNVAPRFGAGLIGAFGLIVTLSLLLTFVPSVTLGAGAIAILVLCIISTVVNIAISRLRLYNELDFKYVNLVQGTGLIKLIGFIVFFANVLKTGFLHSFISSMSDYLGKALEQVSNINKSIETANKFSSTKMDYLTMEFGYVIDLILMLVAATLALGVCTSLVKSVAAQLGLVAKKKVAKPASLSNGIIALIVCIIPVVVSKLENKIFYKMKIGSKIEITQENAGSIFVMSDSGKSALVGMFIGAALILAAGIVFIVTKKIFCNGMSSEHENLVLAGDAPIVEAAVAEEAVVEDVAVEETVAEEAVVEEAATEEAVVEEAAAEEVAVEE